MPSSQDYPAAEYEPAIARAVSRLTSAQLSGTRDEDDLRQEARIAVWRAHQRSGSTLDGALVYTIAYRRGIDYVRQHCRSRAGYARQPLSLDWQADRAGHDVCLADDGIAAATTALDLRAAIEALPSPRHRRFVALVLYDGLSVREAGLALGYAPASASPTWWAIKRQLRHAIDGEAA